MTVIFIQCAAFWFMAGVTWSLQILNYPLMEKINSSTFASYQEAHNRRFGKVMIPGVLVSVLTTILLLVSQPDEVSITIPVIQILLLLIITGSAAIYAAPAHKKLEQNFDQISVRSLIMTNWLRLIAWLALALSDLYLLIQLISSH